MTASWRGRVSKALTLGAVVLLQGALVVDPASSASAAPWYSSGYNAAGSQANIAESTLTPATVGRVVHKRTIAAPGTGIDCDVTSTYGAGPLIEVGGFTYVVANNVVMKANTSTGAVAWRRPLGTVWDYYSQRGGIAYSSGYVFVGAQDCGSHSDPAGAVVALNASTGAVAWKRSGFDGGLWDLVVSRGVVITGGSTDGGGGVLSAWRASDGTLLWQDRSDYFTYGLPVAVVGGVVISRTFDDHTGTVSLQGMSLATGAVKWTKNGYWEVQAGDLSGTAGHSLFVTTSSGRINELNPVTGAFVGAYPTTASNVLAVDGSRVYATCVSGTITAGVCAYSRSTRTQLWIKAHDVSSAAVGGAVLYLGDGTALNSATGATLKRLWNGTGYVVVADGHVLAVLDATDTQVQVYGL